MIRDVEARQTALDPTRSFIVQAPAGSGKTGLLVYRVLRLLARVEQPQQILAITFTRKATSEMRERVFDLMQMAEAGKAGRDDFEQTGVELAHAALKRDQELAWNLLSSPHQLQILTIDSFCAKLTSSMPWLSRLGDRPKTTDQAEVHYAAAVEQLLAELLSDTSPILPALQTVMLELDYNYPKARQLFTSMLSKRDQWLRYLLRRDLSELRGSLESTWLDIVDSDLRALRDMLPDETLRKMVRLASYAAQILLDKPEYKRTPLSAFEHADGTNVEAKETSIETLSLAQWKGLVFMLVAPSSAKFRKSVSVTVGFPPKTEEKESLTEVLAEFADDEQLLSALNQVSTLPPIRYSDQDWQQLLALEQVLKSLAAHLQLRFRAVGECDHSEVTQRANLALQEMRNPTDLALRMDYSLHHILVDEFQDTSTGQIDLLKKLTAGWSDAGSSDFRQGDSQHNSSQESGSQQSGPQQSGSQQSDKTLFLVGDPMQSIYRFREADVSLFLQVADNQQTQVFDNLQIESLSLSENFRSSSRLVDWFNSTFESSFPAQDKVLTGAIRYAPATFSREPNHGDVEYLLAQDKQHEASLLAQAVQSAVQQLPTQEDRVAILVRSRSQLDYLLPSLRAANIEYVGVDIQPLREQQAVIDLIALCKALCREDDRLSWLALLRGPWCGLSLMQIKQIAASNDLTVWQQLSGLAGGEASNIGSSKFDDETRTKLSRFMDVMLPAMQQRQQVELASLTRWVWRGLGGEQTLFGASLDDIETVFELIRNLQRAGDLSSMSELESALDGLFAQPTESASRNARVVVSTMHKAKGLQYHTVILPGLANQARAEDKSIMMWAEQQNSHGQPELLLAPLSMEPEDSDHYSYLRQLDSKRARNELIRLMYVATTRAERKLVLLARAKLDPKTEEVKAPISSSLLATVWQALDTKFVLDTQSFTEQQDELVISNVLSRLPTAYRREFEAEVDWNVMPLLTSTAETDELSERESDEESEDGAQQKVEFAWATNLAKGVGIVLHDWLQFIGPEVLTTPLDQHLQNRWRSELVALRVPNNRINAALQRLLQAAKNIQSDEQARFIFQDYEIQENEYALATYIDGAVKDSRIDRTFVDHDDVRWIVDYKSTFTQDADLEQFVDNQVQERHRGQLQKYGELLSQIDSRSIKLAVYFPLLNQLRVWDYQAD